MPGRTHNTRCRDTRGGAATNATGVPTAVLVIRDWSRLYEPPRGRDEPAEGMAGSESPRQYPQIYVRLHLNNDISGKVTRKEVEGQRAALVAAGKEHGFAHKLRWKDSWQKALGAKSEMPSLPDQPIHRSTD